MGLGHGRAHYQVRRAGPRPRCPPGRARRQWPPTGDGRRRSGCKKFQAVSTGSRPESWGRCAPGSRQLAHPDAAVRGLGEEEARPSESRLHAKPWVGCPGGDPVKSGFGADPEPAAAVPQRGPNHVAAQSVCVGIGFPSSWPTQRISPWPATPIHNQPFAVDEDRRGRSGAGRCAP